MIRGAVGISAALLAIGSSSASDTPLGLPDLTIPHDNRQTTEKIELGRSLFFDKKLSVDGTISCADCHSPNKAFGDGRRLSRGLRGAEGTRNAPSLANVAFNQTLFWDGRSTSLEEQAMDPLLHPREHGFTSSAQVVRAIRADERYVLRFKRVFGMAKKDIQPGHIVKALASFQRSLLYGSSPSIATQSPRIQISRSSGATSLLKTRRISANFERRP